MPSSATITSSQITTFVTRTTISSEEVNNNFSTFRGHILPVDPNTSTAIDNTYALGSSEYYWTNTYTEQIDSKEKTTFSKTLSLPRATSDNTNTSFALGGFLLEYTTVSGTHTVSMPSSASMGAGTLFLIKDASGSASSAAPLRVNPNGSETVDSESSLEIQEGLGHMLGYSDGVNLKSISRSGFQGAVWLHDQNGYGSTLTKTHKYSTVIQDDSPDMTLTQSASNGDSITVNKSGVYSVVLMFNYNTGSSAAGITKNYSGTGSIENEAVAAENKLAIAHTGDSANEIETITWVGHLDKGDVIRSHARGNVDGTPDESQQFYMKRIG